MKMWSLGGRLELVLFQSSRRIILLLKNLADRQLKHPAQHRMDGVAAGRLFGKTMCLLLSRILHGVPRWTLSLLGRTNINGALSCQGHALFVIEKQKTPFMLSAGVP